MKEKKKKQKKEKKVDLLKDFKKLNPKPVEVKKKG
jgi:hypothetical protein